MCQMYKSQRQSGSCSESCFSPV